MFDYIHAVDSFKLASYSDRIAIDLGLHPKKFLQVNQSGEESKGGLSLSELQEQIHQISDLKHLAVVGLMTIPPAIDHQEDARHWFTEMRILRDDIKKDYGNPLFPLPRPALQCILRTVTKP